MGGISANYLCNNNFSIQLGSILKFIYTSALWFDLIIGFHFITGLEGFFFLKTICFHEQLVFQSIFVKKLIFVYCTT